MEFVVDWHRQKSILPSIGSGIRFYKEGILMELELEPLEPQPEKNDSDSWQPGGYQGIERRQVYRRVSSDRRSLIRFESGGADRRSGGDRRAGETPWNSFYRV